MNTEKLSDRRIQRKILLPPERHFWQGHMQPGLFLWPKKDSKYIKTERVSFKLLVIIILKITMN